MIILGIILLIVGFVFSIPILWTIGIILIVVGAIGLLVGHWAWRRRLIAVGRREPWR